MEPTVPTPDREEMRLLYQVTVSDLAFFKSQQWSVTNYTMLALAAFVGVEQILKPVAYCAERWALAALAVAAACSGLYLLWKLEKSISVRRSRLDSIRNVFTDTFHFSWAAEDKGDEYLAVIHILYGVVFVAGALACWLLLARL